MKEKILLIKHIESEVKLIVVITDLMMTLYVLWLIGTNTSTWIPGVLFGFTPLGAYELLRAGKLFHLCTTYKLMILHILAVYGCCVYQAQYGFGETLPYFRASMFLIGLGLIISVIIKLLCCNERCCKKNAY